MTVKTLDGYKAWLKSIGSVEAEMYPGNRRLPDRSAMALIGTMPPDRVRVYVETGTFKGFSMGLAGYFFLDAMILTVDPVFHDEAKLIADSINEPYRVGFYRSLDRAFRVNLGTMPPIDLALIDGDHRYEAAKLDLQRILPRMAPGGVIAFDNLTHIGGCGQVFRELDGPTIESKWEIPNIIGFARIKAL